MLSNVSLYRPVLHERTGRCAWIGSVERLFTAQADKPRAT
jgi:hypothetical protein